MSALSVSLALNPAWANVEATVIKSADATPKFLDKLVISSERPFSCEAEESVTCCSFTNSLSNATNAVIPFVRALVKANITLVTLLKAANLLTARADCLPNSSISPMAALVCFAAVVVCFPRF